jgi:transglutaminase-like putative cysteine protease/tetratricopeptide (TPR) repeat protein
MAVSYSKFIIALLFVLLSSGEQVRAQGASAASREAQWQAYHLPAAQFVRYIDKEKQILFRAPADWQRQGDQFEFKGPDGIELRVIVEEYPDGAPLKAYVTALLQGLRGLPGGADAVTLRRTHLSGIEAREIMFEVSDLRGAMLRQVIWSAVDGPRAVSFVFTTPLVRASQVEPYFKAVIQSAVLLSNYAYYTFEQKRTSFIKESKPARIDQALNIAATLDGFDPAARAKVIPDLARIFAESPDSAIDLMLDSRPLVRGGTVEAMAMSGNKSLVQFLFDSTYDPDLYVAERAARGLASFPDVTALLREDSKNWTISSIQRIVSTAAFLDVKTRLQIAVELFKKEAAVKVSPAPPAKSQPPPPPPPRATKSKPSKIPPLAIVEVSGGFATSGDLYTNRHFVAAHLLRGVPPAQFKMPIEEIIAAQNERVTASALQIALERDEQLPVGVLFKLLSSPSREVARLAAVHLGESAGAADLPGLESLAVQLSSQPKIKDQTDKPDESKITPVAEEIKVTVKKIRLRQQMNAADQALRAEAIEKTMKDPQIAAWVWSKYARDDRQAPAPNSPKAAAVAPLGENVFPPHVTFYAALPDPAGALDKLGASLNGIQIDSARSQASFVLMMNAMKEMLLKYFGAQPGTSFFDHAGLNGDEPVALASWTAQGAPRGLGDTERKAVVFRVKDRDRFERVLAHYQWHVGDFGNLPEMVSVFARFIGLAPAIIPMAGAAAAGNGGESVRPHSSGFRFYVISSEECQGLPVKVIERREVETYGRIKRDAVHLAYVGDAAIVAPDRESLKDVLSRLSSGGPGIGQTSEFRRAVAAGGDAIYMSDLGAVFGVETGKRETGQSPKVSESGALKISSAAWENSYHLSFADREWTKLLLPFNASELASPRELLPRSSLAYFFAKLDVAGAWKQWGKEFFGEKEIEDIIAAFAMDFEKEIIPEVGPECGVAALGAVSFDSKSISAPWVIFCELKSEKLAEAFRAGKLFKDQTPDGFARFRAGSADRRATVKNGFLVFSDSEATLGRLDEKERLWAARDFDRAAGKAPPGVIAFGGYNIEAAASEMASQLSDPSMEEFLIAMTSLMRAFHSQSFYALASEAGVEARLSVSLDRESRYSVAELSSIAKDYEATNVVIPVRGVPVGNQQRIDSLKLKIRARSAGAVDRIKEDIGVEHQTAEKISDKELVVTVKPRRASDLPKTQLPIKGAEFAAFLKPSREIRSEDAGIIAKAREITGDERDAWAVARKLADWTHKNIKWKRVDSADAVQTLATLEADCLEFSELYIAMARSVGLPARMVRGLAYSGASFGAHAWVEVYAGRWVELDPTWGTEFADATHIRGSSGELINFAALDAIEIEMVEATHSIPDFQRDAQALAEKLCEELSRGEHSALESALDVTALADKMIGAGAWAGMSAADRDQMTSAYITTLRELASAFKDEGEEQGTARLLKVERLEDRAIAFVMEQNIFDESLVRFEFIRRGQAWMLVEVVRADTDFQIISELMGPTARAVSARRSGSPVVPSQLSDFARALMVLGQDAGAAVEIADQSLKNASKSSGLRFVKALGLIQLEKMEDALNMLEELAGERYAPAVLRLAQFYQVSDGEEGKKKAIEIYERYLEMVPQDPRAQEKLASLYRHQKEMARAVAASRAAIRLDPRSADRHTDLAELLALDKHYAEALAEVDKGASKGKSAQEIFADLVVRLAVLEDKSLVEELVSAEPGRMEKNAKANLNLAYPLVFSGRARDALPLLKKALALDPKSTETLTTLAEAYRTLGQWSLALVQAEAAIKIDGKNGDAYYHKACALARLGRKVEAMRALRQAVELDEDWVYEIEEEPDLKPLAGMAEFKKLLKENEDK